MPTSSENRKPEAQETRGQTPDGPTPGGHDGPGRLNEMAAGGMASLLMTQPVRWPGVVAEFRHTNPDDAFGKLALWPEPGERGPGPGRSGLSTSSVCEALWFLDP